MVGRDPLRVVDGVLLVQVDGVPPSPSQQEETIMPGPGRLTVAALLEPHCLRPVPALPLQAGLETGVAVTSAGRQTSLAVVSPGGGQRPQAALRPAGGDEDLGRAGVSSAGYQYA